MATCITRGDILGPVAGDAQAENEQEGEQYPLQPEPAGYTCIRRFHLVRCCSYFTWALAPVKPYRQQQAYRGHAYIDDLPGTYAKSLHPVFSKQVCKNSEKRIPEDKLRENYSTGRLHAGNPQQQGNQ